MKLATTISDFYRYGITPAEAVRLYEGTSFRYLDYNFYKEIYPGSPFLTDDWMARVRDAAKAAEQLGYTFIQAHSPGYDNLDMSKDQHIAVMAAKRSIEACDYLGIRDLVVHAGCNYLQTHEKERFFELNRDFFRELIPTLEKHNVNMLIENGVISKKRPRYDFTTAEEMTEFIAYMDHPLIHACLDVGHSNLLDVNLYDEICTLDSQLRGLHIQDNFGQNDEHIAPFMGTMNLDAIMQGLLEIGYSGYFTFECTNILLKDGVWPRRKGFEGKLPNRLMRPSLELKAKSIELLYEIGKFILTSYDCFEE